LLIKTATVHWSANFETVTVVTQYVQTARTWDKSLFNPNNRIAPWYRSIIFRFITNGITNALPISKSTTISGTRRMARGAEAAASFNTNKWLHQWHSSVTSSY
jgi:hypothetical protein